MPYFCKENVVSIYEIHQKYIFRKKIGQGSFCDVFLAENRISGDLVAIKMMKVNPNSEKSIRRVINFHHEAEINSQLNHPNIIKVLDCSETDTGVFYITSEYVKGKTLAELLIKENKLSIMRTINIMQQILDGMGEAHGKGIIHGDLKPENIMVVSGGQSEQIKIFNFRISAAVGNSSEEQDVSSVIQINGTPLYAAPELLCGEMVTKKADIYAWGLLFLECVTGKSSFSADRIAAIVQRQLSPLPQPLPVEEIISQLCTLLNQTLEKNIYRRTGDTKSIASQLKKISLKIYQ